ncbi:hypothetical protein J2S78_003159 [Salibacterium salarium]|uniref:hypothetical protein n=1 Tax=Salibacterium salarium TaxID=284579 RepID=UPI002782AB81|nr:hypothetical protein [Salibacterium salarium]MDQ0300691.1 hypothetical protein [Salibacterium salarium]
MKINVKYHHYFLGEIDYTSMISFSRFCEEKGFTLKWDLEENTLLIMSGLAHQTITFFTEERQQSLFLSDFIKSFKHILLDTGITIEEVRGTRALTEKNLNMKWFDTMNEHITIPKVNIFYNLSPKHKNVKTFLENQLENLEIEFVSKKEKNNLPSPTLVVQCELPPDFENFQTWMNKVSLGFGAGICHYLCEKLDKSTLSFSPASLIPFLHHVKPDTIDDEHSPIKTEDNSDADVEEHHISSKTELNAEVFFDYTIFPSTSKNQFIASGDLYIKNTGDAELINPLICMKVQPTELINVGGQILPPEVADVLGVQSSTGMRGWKFMDSDWFEKAQDRGEYWIGPIEHLRIPVGEISSLPRFQLTIEKPEEKVEAIIRSVVFFQDKNVSFPSNNDIRFSF